MSGGAEGRVNQFFGNSFGKTGVVYSQTFIPPIDLAETRGHSA